MNANEVKLNWHARGEVATAKADDGRRIIVWREPGRWRACFGGLNAPIGVGLLPQHAVADLIGARQ